MVSTNSKGSLLLVLASLILFSATPATALKGSGHSHASKTTKVKKDRKDKCETCARDKHGKIKRDKKAEKQFQHDNPCPSTGKKSGKCPGYVVDHRTPLA